MRTLSEQSMGCCPSLAREGNRGRGWGSGLTQGAGEPVRTVQSPCRGEDPRGPAGRPRLNVNRLVKQVTLVSSPLSPHPPP